MKISDISKDFNLKSKDVVDVFKEAGIEKKNSGAAVDEEEFEIFFSLITKSHQIKNIDAYTGGFNLQIAFASGYIAGKFAAGYEY